MIIKFSVCWSVIRTSQIKELSSFLSLVGQRVDKGIKNNGKSQMQKQPHTKALQRILNDNSSVAVCARPRLALEGWVWSGDQRGKGPGRISGKVEELACPSGSDGERHSHRAGRRWVWSDDQKEKAQVEFQGWRRATPYLDIGRESPDGLFRVAFPDYISSCTGLHKNRTPSRWGRHSRERPQRQDKGEMRSTASSGRRWFATLKKKPCFRSLIQNHNNSVSQ